VLDESPGSVVKPPAPTPPLNSFLDSAQNFVDTTLPLVSKEHTAYARREAELAKQGGGR
jgi:hypothetical protein